MPSVSQPTSWAPLALLKQRAADYAIQFVESGMVLGLGGGSTAALAIAAIAERLRAGELQRIVSVPCSTQVEAEARRLGVPLTTLEDHLQIDLTINGADEVDPQLNLIKGGGGALPREKIVAQATAREVIIVDETKLSRTLGARHTLPVGVLPFGWRTQEDFLRSLGARATLRTAVHGPAFTTDQGNLILDCDFGVLDDPVGLALQLQGRDGIVAHGLFLGLASDVVVGTSAGIRHLRRDEPY